VFGVREEGLTVSSIRRFKGGRKGGLELLALFGVCRLLRPCHDAVGSGLDIFSLSGSEKNISQI
jgi:hypothetical protein